MKVTANATGVKLIAKMVQLITNQKIDIVYGWTVMAFIHKLHNACSHEGSAHLQDPL